MLDQENSLGLVYRALDLHVHTPASDDYKDKGASAADIVDAAIAGGLDGICITDHNSAEWVDKVAKAAKGKPLVVYPGFEVSVTGGKDGPIHIIGIFDPGRTAEDLNDVLSEVGLTKTKRGRTDRIAKGAPNEVIEAIAKHGGLPVLAHADSTHGVLHDMKGQPRIEVVQNPTVAAAEVSIEKYRGFLDGTDPSYQRELATFEASDAHSLAEIGSKFSYFKVQALSLEGLRQCFYDYRVRIHLRDQHQPVPNPHIASVSVSNGFFEGETVRFHDGLNALVGGQGVGKSLIVELLRFGLEQGSKIEPIALDASGKLEEQLGKDGSVVVRIALANGMQYEVTRTYDGMTSPTIVQNLETEEFFAGDLAALFPVIAYSQTEAISIARDSNAQRRLIDQFIDAPRYLKQIGDIQKDLRRNDLRLVKVIDAKEELADAQRDLSTQKEELKNLEKTLENPVLEEMKAADLGRSAWDSHVEYHSKLISAIDELAKGFSLSHQPPPLDRPLTSSEGLATAQRLAQESLQGVLDTMKASVTKVTENQESIRTGFREWLTTYEEIEQRYQEFLKTAGGDQQRLETRRKECLKRLDDLDTKVKALDAQSEQLTQVLEDRKKLLDKLDGVGDALFETRKKKYDELTALSDGKLQLDVRRGANYEDFSAALQEIATGTRIRKNDLDRLAAAFSPRDFIQHVLDNNVEALAAQCDVSRETTEKLINWLKMSQEQEIILELQYQYLRQDDPSIRFKKADDQYYELSGLSTGQKCTALLIIALTSGEVPVIVDQPEEAVDIAFVYNDIVSKLRKGKESRQFILTTHNPNIAVTSDADLLHVLKASATRGRVVYSGAIEDENVRKEAIQHLEGGESPYLLRGKKYGLIDENASG